VTRDVSVPPRERVEALFRVLPTLRVVVVGDVMLDRYLMGDIERISPEAPVPVVHVREQRDAPGGAANVAANVAAAGAMATLVGVVGKDGEGDALRTRLGSLGVSDAALHISAARPTTTKTRVVARGQQVCRIDQEVDGPLDAEDAAAVEAMAHATLAGAHALLLEDYDKGTLAPHFVARLMDRARQARLPVVVDPKFRQFFAYSGATVFKPNSRELAAALGAGVDLAHLQALEAAWRRLGADHLLVTLGADGMAIVSGMGQVRRVRSRARQVFDVSGAGDTVTAWLGLMLAAGATIEEAAELANAAAGAEVAKAGVATVTCVEVVESLYAG
jgi:D-beta-D-heptose 7-phosphate kinase/D-beta-D-heptose 1-phosphate adenosyltransferase